MNKNAIKKFAIDARNKLIASVTDKAGMLGITPDNCSEAITKGADFEVYKTAAGTEVTLNKKQCEQRRKLVDQIHARGFEAVVEEVAYTWFNRICAIRFMEVNDYMYPVRVRVLSSEKEGKNEPDVVTMAPDIDWDFTDKEREEIIDAKMNNRLDDLFRMLFIKQCNLLHEVLPGLFEETEDYTEMLLNISFTNEDDVIRMLVDGIDEKDFNITTVDEDGKAAGQVEIIGWLYQYYNTEPKNKAFAKKAKITKEEIPAVTQLFTPDWIVRYMGMSLGHFQIAIEKELDKRGIQHKAVKINYDLSDTEEFFIEPTNNYDELAHKSDRLNYQKEIRWILYTGYDERKISANYKLRPGIYLVSTANLCSYDMSKMQAIEFIGGTLNNLYQQTQIATKYDEERKCYIKTYPVFKKEYSVKIKDIECKLILQNMPSENSPSIMNLIVRYEFPKEMPIKIIKLTYNVLMKICRFMTNRENVGFDEVRLYQIDDETGKWFKFADGFLDYQYDNFTNKKYQQNILFDDIDECIANLHSVMSADTEGKATYLFDFYSDNDKDYSILSDDKIKNICSSIECELDFVTDLKDDENTNLEDLIKSVKAVIKQHRKSDKKLEDKTYDMIFNSISHWGMANSRKIYLLYKKQDYYMKILNEKAKLSCTEEDIAAFVKYRNDITHGRYRTLDSVIAATAYALMALAYCCFLLRMGIKNDKLKLLFETNRIAS